MARGQPTANRASAAPRRLRRRQDEFDVYARDVLQRGGRSRCSATNDSRRRRRQDRRAGLRRHDDAAAASRRSRTSTTRGSAGCSGWCTPSGRCRRRWRSSGTTTSPPATPRSPARSAPPRPRGCWRPSRPKIRRQSRGQIELFRDYALGNFRDLLVAVAKDPAMLVWLDGRTNIAARPQENFGREIMELFTIGVGTLHRSRRLRRGARCSPAGTCAAGQRRRQLHYEFVYNAGQHDTDAKTFTFPIYPNGSKTIPARAAGAGHAGRHRPDRCGRAGRRCRRTRNTRCSAAPGSSR